MLIVDSFLPLLQVFFLSMSEPTGRAWISFVSGWLFLPGRSLADRIRAAGERHGATHYRLLSSARWSMEEVSFRFLTLFLRWWPQDTLMLAGDDTFVPRKGAKLFGAGMHRDPCLSTRQRQIKRWGHCWVVLAVVLRSRHDERLFYCLPIMSRLYFNTATAKKLDRPYRSKTDLMLEMLKAIEQHLPQQKLHFLGDYGYTAPAVLGRMPPRIEVTGRVHCRAKLFAPAPPRRPGRGRPRVRGERLPAPFQLLKERGQRRRLAVAPSRIYRVRCASQSGCFYQTPGRMVKMVALEHLGKRREKEAFYSTVLAADVLEIVQWYSQRWGMEVAFRDAKQHLHLGAAQNRTPRAVGRTVPTGLMLYSLVLLWHERHAPASPVRDCPGKRHPSFADMLAALRHDSLAQSRQRHLSDSHANAEFTKTLEFLEKLLALAA